MNWVIKLNSINIHTSSVAHPWSNIWPITWWTADICVFLFLSSNATATASLFSVGWFITHAKVSSKRGAYSWQSLMILLKDNVPDFLEKCYAALIYFSLDKEFCIDLQVLLEHTSAIQALKIQWSIISWKYSVLCLPSQLISQLIAILHLWLFVFGLYGLVCL